MPTATVRRSLVRGVVAVLLMSALATTSGVQDPVELHVIGRSSDDPAATADTHEDASAH